MTRTEKAKRLSEMPECVAQNISLSAIMRHVPEDYVHRCFSAVFTHHNHGALARLIATAQVNRTNGYLPNKRRSPVVKIARRHLPQRPYQMSLSL